MSTKKTARKTATKRTRKRRDFNFFPMLPFGAKLNRPCGRVEFRLYKPNGTCGDNPGPNPEDIILPNTTNFPWADMPKWARFVAMDAIGEAFWYGDRPQARDILWYTNGSSDLIPKEYIPSWYKSLPWEQSLLERPLP